MEISKIAYNNNNHFMKALKSSGLALMKSLQEFPQPLAFQHSACVQHSFCWLSTQMRI